jgi:hypothetical protein
VPNECKRLVSRYKLRTGSLNCQCNPSRRNGTEIQSITSMYGGPPKLAPAARLSAMHFHRCYAASIAYE